MGMSHEGAWTVASTVSGSATGESAYASVADLARG